MSFSAKQMALLSDLHKDLGKALIVAMYAVPTFSNSSSWVMFFGHAVGALLAISISLYYKQREEQIL